VTPPLKEATARCDGEVIDITVRQYSTSTGFLFSSVAIVVSSAGSRPKLIRKVCCTKGVSKGVSAYVPAILLALVTDSMEIENYRARGWFAWSPSPGKLVTLLRLP
jgi:hypothetical protein